MKNFLFIAFLGVIFFACNPSQNSQNQTVKDSTAKVDTLPAYNPQQTVIEESKIDLNAAYKVATPIIYDVVLRNPTPEDTWATECLKSVDIKTISNLIFKAVYEGKLPAFHYKDDSPMTIDQVNALEKEFTRNRIGKVQFIEDWFLDAKTLTMVKKVKGIMLAYENYESDGKTVRSYKAGIKVLLNEK